jgi:hypothetical protein
MAIPALMIPASAAYLLVNFGKLLGETWAYYWLFGLLEISAGLRRRPDPAHPSSNSTG